VPPRTALANGRVRHVGDPVAFIVADNEEVAREAAELVEIDYEALPAVVDGCAALMSGAPLIWDQAPGNTAFHAERGNAAAPDGGGGFGAMNFLYPGWILLLWAARHLGRPVRWMAERAEEFLASAQGRDIFAKAKLGLDASGKFLALDVAMVANLGAYLSGNG